MGKGTPPCGGAVGDHLFSIAPTDSAVGLFHSTSNSCLISCLISRLVLFPSCSWALATCLAKSSSISPQAAGSFQISARRVTTCRPPAAQKRGISLEFRKNVGAASVWARGPGRTAPEASVGFPLVPKDQSLFPSEEAGGIFPAPSTEKSAPYDSKRAGLAPGPWNRLALMTNLSSKN